MHSSVSRRVSVFLIFLCYGGTGQHFPNQSVHKRRKVKYDLIVVVSFNKKKQPGSVVSVANELTALLLSHATYLADRFGGGNPQNISNETSF